MKRLAIRLAKIIGIIAAVFAVILLVLQLTLNSRWLRSKVDSVAASVMPDGQLRYDRLHFKTFPYFVAEADGLSVTYPHELFSAYDGLGVRGPLLSEGRGAVEDTLLAVDRLALSLNPWKLFCGRVRVRQLALEHPRIYYHAYSEGHSNLDIIASSEEPKDTASKSSGLPWISLGDIRRGERPKIVYTSQADTVHARVRFDELRLTGDVRIKKNKLASKLHGMSLALDSLKLGGRLPADTIRRSRFGTRSARRTRSTRS